jgi:hypothetical protein
VQRQTPLSNIHGLGKVYSQQTMAVSKGSTVKALLQRVQPWVCRRDVDRIARFLQLCAANPRAGEQLAAGYVVPPYNNHVVGILLNVITEQRSRNSSWLPVLDSVRHQLQQRAAHAKAKTGKAEQQHKLMLETEKKNVSPKPKMRAARCV